MTLCGRFCAGEITNVILCGEHHTEARIPLLGHLLDSRGEISDVECYSGYASRLVTFQGTSSLCLRLSRGVNG